jgi:hypothetical protein
LSKMSYSTTDFVICDNTEYSEIGLSNIIPCT